MDAQGNGPGNGKGKALGQQSSDGGANLPGHSEAGLENALANGGGHKYGIYKHLEKDGASVDGCKFWRELRYGEQGCEGGRAAGVMGCQM